MTTLEQRVAILRAKLRQTDAEITEVTELLDGFVRRFADLELRRVPLSFMEARIRLARLGSIYSSKRSQISNSTGQVEFSWKMMPNVPIWTAPKN